MDIKLQLLCILVSFLYGMFIRLTLIINTRFNNTINVILKYLINVIYVFIIVILYIVLIYKINYGIFHLYFFIIMSIGYFLMSKYVNKAKNFTNILKLKMNK